MSTKTLWVSCLNSHYCYCFLPTGIFQVPLDVCVFSFVEALFLFTSQHPTSVYLEKVNFVNNSPIIVLECVDYIKTILDKSHDDSLALALERFNNFAKPEASGYSRQQGKRDPKSPKENFSQTCFERKLLGLDKRPTERRASSLSRAVRQKSFSESEGDSFDKKSEDSRKSQSSPKPSLMRSNSFNSKKTSDKTDQQHSNNGSSKMGHRSGSDSRTRPKSLTYDSKTRSVPHFKPALNTTVFSREKPKRQGNNDRGTQSLHQPMRAVTTTKTKRKAYDDELVATNRRSHEYDFDSDHSREFMSLPVNLKSDKMASEVETQCPICLDEIISPKVLPRCKHEFCKDCIEEQFSRGKPVCPCCGMVYGTIRGDQPRGGRMSIEVRRNRQVPGFHCTGAIAIRYDIPGGVQEVGIHVVERLWLRPYIEIVYFMQLT